jgi:SAM-dependent methyltransferase
MPAQLHRSDPRILGRRTLRRDHRTLAGMLRPGLAVLDVGCGTGAITGGIAEAVGLGGRVVGVDRDESLLELARADHAALPNLRFERGDATALPFHSEFDIVTAARTLQWIADPARAIASMKRAAKPGGLVIVLDYAHERNEWSPEPPAPFNRFYRAFLAWREGNGWDNRMADHMPELFRSAGLAGIESDPQDEIARRGDPDFRDRGALWSEVIENIGPQLVQANLLAESELTEARAAYGSWVNESLVRQTLAMTAVRGTVRKLPLILPV